MCLEYTYILVQVGDSTACNQYYMQLLHVISITCIPHMLTPHHTTIQYIGLSETHAH